VELRRDEIGAEVTDKSNSGAMLIGITKKLCAPSAWEPLGNFATILKRRVKDIRGTTKNLGIDEGAVVVKTATE
jgi:hypothetical protein